MKQIDLKSMELKNKESEILLNFSCDDDDMLFFNGYQTWTLSREVPPTEVIKPLNHAVRRLGKPWGTMKYGDYFFVGKDVAPGIAGVFHGFTYMYKRKGDIYTLIGSTDETNGYTIFYYDRLISQLRIVKDAGFSKYYDKSLHVVCLEGTEDEVFDEWFRLSGITRRPAEPMAGYSSWYNRYDKITDATITEDLEGCAKVLKPGDLFQIDDGWQIATGDWDADPVKFPRGMKASVDDIHAKGFKAGLWLAPYAAAANSSIPKAHPDWLLWHDAKPWYAGSNWNGFFSLDIDNKEVQGYLKGVFNKIFNDWGFDLVKLDFLYAAAPWPTARGDFYGESRGGRMCRAVDYLREWCGDGMILGCGVPLGPAFGKFEYCRIGCDAGLDWENTRLMRQVNNEIVSTKNAISDIYYRRQLDGRAFLNDPDVFFLRDNNIKLTKEQKDMHAKVCAQYGSLLLTSDNMGEYDKEKLDKYDEYLTIWKDKTHTSLDFLGFLK